VIINLGVEVRIVKLHDQATVGGIGPGQLAGNLVRTQQQQQQRHPGCQPFKTLGAKGGECMGGRGECA